MWRKLAILGIIGASFASTPSAMAQLYGDPFGDLRPGYGRRGPPPPDRDDRGYDRGYDGRRGYDYDDGRRYRRGGGRFSDYCATSRGPCRTAPQPVGSNCRCHVDGLLKRGVIQ